MFKWLHRHTTPLLMCVARGIVLKSYIWAHIYVYARMCGRVRTVYTFSMNKKKQVMNAYIACIRIASMCLHVLDTTLVFLINATVFCCASFFISGPTSCVRCCYDYHCRHLHFSNCRFSLVFLKNNHFALLPFAYGISLLQQFRRCKSISEILVCPICTCAIGSELFMFFLFSHTHTYPCRHIVYS